MKLKLTLLSLMLNIAVLASANSDTTRVLFIGNSITYFNDMPFMFEDLANNRGQHVAVSMYAPGGTGFVNHYIDPNVYNLFRQNTWDIIVLQPGSGESAGASWPVATTIQRGHILLDSIYRYSPCAQVYLYEIPYGVPSATTYNTYFTVQEMIRDSVTLMADALNVPMIPAGECTYAYYRAHQNLLLHGSFNDIHPNANGSFLVASAFYAGIFQDSVSNSTFYSSIEPDTARIFFSIADTTVLNNLSRWRINTYNLHADYDYNLMANTVAFTNHSTNYTNLTWDFGDGQSSTLPNPSHTYAASGTYTVTLRVYNANACLDTISRTITIDTTNTGLHTPVLPVLNLSPNPSQDLLTIQGLGDFSTPQYKIIHITGQECLTGSLSRQHNTIETASLNNGLYLLLLYDKGQLIGQYKFTKLD